MGQAVFSDGQGNCYHQTCYYGLIDLAINEPENAKVKVKGKRGPVARTKTLVPEESAVPGMPVATPQYPQSPAAIKACNTLFETLAALGDHTEVYRIVEGLRTGVYMQRPPAFIVRK